MLAGEPDIVFHFCQNPAEAIETANALQPTVILQDLVMPDIDGLMLVKFFRANKSTRETPLIVLSSKEEPAIKAQAFALGANDYLVKLPDKLEVVARIRYHSRGYVALLERNEAYAPARRDAAPARRGDRRGGPLRPVAAAREADRAGRVRLAVRAQPDLGGDMFGYHWIDRDHLAVYLLDVSGHGVGSSLLAVSAANVLVVAVAARQSISASPASVMTRLNDVFQMDRQDEQVLHHLLRRLPPGRNAPSPTATPAIPTPCSTPGPTPPRRRSRNSLRRTRSSACCRPACSFQTETVPLGELRPALGLQRRRLRGRQSQRRHVDLSRVFAVHEGPCHGFRSDRSTVFARPHNSRRRYSE